MLLASAYDQSKFLKADDLKSEKKLRIKTVTEELIGQGHDKEKKLVVWFTNDPHGLVLNRVNNRTIRGAYGDAVSGWDKKIIIVFPVMVDFRGKMTPALRVRIPAPKAAAAPPPQTVSPSGNGAAVVKAEVDDPELTPDPVPPPADDLNDEIDF